MDAEIENSLNKIAKGGFFILASTFIGILMTFIIKLLIVRNLSAEEVGILSIIFTIINICVSLSTIGLVMGVTRFISLYLSNKEYKKVRAVIRSSISLTIITSILFFIIVFLSSNLISIFFNNSNLGLALRIYSFSIPLLVIFEMFIAIFRGYSRINIKVKYQDILYPFFIFLFLISLLVIGFNLINVLIIYIISILLVLSIFLIKYYKSILKFLKKPYSKTIKKTLILFSLPIFFKQILSKIMSWTDIIILGLFFKETLVGIYHVSFSLASYIKIILSSISFIYVPIMSSLINKKVSFRKIYSIITKWIFFITFPVFIIMSIYPKEILVVLYGSNYISGYLILNIILIAFIIHILVGPNGVTLSLLGDNKFLLYGSLFTAIINLILNLILIHYIGIIGAAISTSFSLTLMNLISTIRLYKKHNIHAFSKKYIKIIVLYFILFLVMIFLRMLNTHFIFILIYIFIFFIFIFFFIFEKEDKNIYYQIKKLISKFKF